jgi:hypothetical protein
MPKEPHHGQITEIFHDIAPVSPASESGWLKDFHCSALGEIIGNQATADTSTKQRFVTERVCHSPGHAL